MLKTECPSCKCWVYSPFLSEMKTTECPSCGKPFEVADVYISAGPYSIYRDVLLKNMHKYLRLLREARNEMSDLEQKGHKSKGYQESAKTVNEFVSRLKELLDGCRDKLRVGGDETTVEYMLDKNLYKGHLVNISATGICIDAGDNAANFSKDQGINLTIKGEGMPETLYLNGRIVWTNIENHLGITFVDMDDRQRKVLQDFILEKSLIGTG